MDSRRKEKVNSFFRFILSDNVNDTGLRIPKKFASNHGRKILLNEVVLVVSDDAVRVLDWMVSADGELWLKKGWREFAEDYCLGIGSLLVFNYHGKSVFNVRIFDTSNCEINYLNPTKFPEKRESIIKRSATGGRMYLGSRRKQKPKSFFKFILSDNVKNTGLNIPIKFVSNHGKKILLNEVALVVSDDTVWVLNWMVTDDGELWLKKGWPEFADHYCLRIGHLLVFDYHGKSVFHVRIFDPINCEINYLNPTNSPAMKNGKRYHKLKKAAAIETENDVEWRKKRRRQRNAARKRAIKLAEVYGFKSDNPFVLVTIRPSHLKRRTLYMSKVFARRYLIKDNENGKGVGCVLQRTCRRSWGPVSCTLSNHYCKLHGNGWTRFRLVSHVAVGDVCVFELVNRSENVLKLTLFRGKKVKV